MKDIQVENENRELEVIDKTSYNKFLILLYPDTTSYNCEEVLNYLKSYKKWAYIEHVPESTEKKSHIHFILILPDKTTFNSLSKKSGVPKQFIQAIDNLRTVNRYLIHLGYDDKIQYSKDDVFISDGYKRQFNKSFEDLESDDIIINKIRSKIIDLTTMFNKSSDIEFELIKYVESENYDRIFKKYYMTFKNIILDNLT